MKYPTTTPPEDRWFAATPKFPARMSLAEAYAEAENLARGGWGYQDIAVALWRFGIGEKVAREIVFGKQERKAI